MNLAFPLQILLLGAIWGASFLFMRVAVQEFKPLALIEIRVAIGALLLMGVLAVRGEWHSMRGRWRALAFLGIMNTAVPFSLFAFAAQYLTASLASVLNSTAPLFGALIGFLCFQERLRATQVLGLFFGFAGVVLLATSKSGLAGNLLAIGAGLTAASLYGVSAHFSKRHLQGCPPLAVSCGSLIAASLVLLPSMLWSYPTQVPSWKAWGCVIMLGVLCTGVAYMLYFRLIRQYGTERSMIVAYLIPIFGVLWGFLFLDENITLQMILGGGVVLLGTLMVTRGAKR